MTADSTQTVDVTRLSFETLIGDNPVLEKHCRSRLRRQQVLPGIVALLIVAALIIWSSFKLDAVEEGVAFIIITSLQGVILFLGGTSQVSTAVAQARESGILDFHRISPLRSLCVTAGFVLGAPIREWLMFACLIPFSLACVAGGNPSALGWLMAMVAMVVSGLLFHAIGALTGVTSKPRTAGSAAVMVVVLLFFFSGVFWRLTPGPAIAEVIGQGDEIPLAHLFFGKSFSHFTLGLLHQIPLIIFLLIATVRKFRNEGAFVYAKPTAILFLFLLAVYLLGDTHSWSYAQEAFEGFESVFVSYFMLVASIMLTTAVTPGWGAFTNGVRRSRKAGRASLGAMADLAPNFAPVAAFAAFTFLAPVLSAVLRKDVGDTLTATTLGGLVAAATVITFGFAHQTFGLVFRKAANGYFALFLFLLWIVPLMLGLVTGITEMKEQITYSVLAFSPFAGIGLTSAMNDPTMHAQAAPMLAAASSLVVAVVCVVWGFMAAGKAKAEA